MWWSRPSAVGEYVLLADVPEVLVYTEQGQRVTWASEFFLGVSGVLRGHLYLASTSLTCRAALAPGDPLDEGGDQLGHPASRETLPAVTLMHPASEKVSLGADRNLY